MFIFKTILRKYYQNKYRNAEMVQYWRHGDSVHAKLTTAPEGHYIMHMEGEKYPFPGHPRGVLLYGPLSPLKHEIKNRIFNAIWYELERNLTPIQEENLLHFMKTDVLPGITAILDKGRYDMVPVEKMTPVVREIHRAFSVIEAKTGNNKVQQIKDLICFILQEDDAYRFRFQWMAKFFNPNSLWRKVTKRDVLKDFDLALSMLEQGESIDDMKERQRLLRRGLMFILTDPGVRNCFDLFIHELDWKKVQLSKADKYFFRAKYFKVDWPEYQY
jgi:hypothetical protein